MHHQRDIRILLCADTHLGFDEPVRPRVEKRRRGPDFFANFQRILDAALDGRVDLVVHGGDLFFRSRVPAPIVDRVYKMLIDFATHDIPILIVPGNHERSMLPSSLYLNHPNIHVFAEPTTKLFEFAGTKIAFAGFPCERKEVRRRFRSLVTETGWADVEADVRFLCLHQAIEGAQVGPSNFTFRRGDDVIPMADLPSGFDAVLSGHIHRRQILTHNRPDGSSMPVVYPGSIERTSFAEKAEPKGYFVVTVSDSKPEERRRLDFQFVQLPARPMEDIVIESDVDRRGVRTFLKSRLDDLDPNSIVRFKCADGVPSEVRAALTGRLLREVSPETMNIQFGAEFFGRAEAQSQMIRSPQHSALVEAVRGRVPEKPGVYLFYGERDEILYVGKAVNLKQRMLGHLRQDPQKDEPGHSRLVYAIRRFDYETTESELLALLREDELIKQHRPRFNVRQNEILEYKYLELTDDEYPRLRMIDHADDFGDRRVFGPYRDRYLVDRILQLIHQHLGLRSCVDIDPVGKCLEFDLGHCVGPCREGMNRGDYTNAVTRAVAFLEGDVTEVASQLQRAMELASGKLEFEKAQELKERLEFCERFGERQRFLREFRQRRLVIEEECDPGQTYVFLRGRLVGTGSTRPVPTDSDDDPRCLLDRAAIVHSWLCRNSDRCEYNFS